MNHATPRLRRAITRLLAHEVGRGHRASSEDMAAASGRLLDRLSQRLSEAKRIVIDSLSGFEMAVSPGFREDFRESLYRLVGVLTGLGVTVMMTLEIEDSYAEFRLGPRENAFLTDVIILQRYVEIEGHLKRIMTVVKVRGSEHSKDLRLYEVTSKGLVLDGTAPAYSGLLTGNAIRSSTKAPERRRASRPRQSGRDS